MILLAASARSNSWASSRVQTNIFYCFTSKFQFWQIAARVVKSSGSRSSFHQSFTKCSSVIVWNIPDFRFELLRNTFSSLTREQIHYFFWNAFGLFNAKYFTEIIMFLILLSWSVFGLFNAKTFRENFNNISGCPLSYE